LGGHRASLAHGTEDPDTCVAGRCEATEAAACVPVTCLELKPAKHARLQVTSTEDEVTLVDTTGATPRVPAGLGVLPGQIAPSS
jgi:hypothetical protein